MPVPGAWNCLYLESGIACTWSLELPVPEAWTCLYLSLGLPVPKPAESLGLPVPGAWN